MTRYKNNLPLVIANTNVEIDSIPMVFKAGMLADLRKRFDNNEIVEFDYIKKSTGNLRHAIGCLHPSIILPRIKGTGNPKSKYRNFTYFDLEKHQFRSFGYDNIVKVY